MAEALRGGPRYDIEYRGIRPDGELRFLHGQADLVRDECGQPFQLFGTLQDVTARKLAEQRLLAQHAVAQVLTTASTLEEVAPSILRTVCESLVWDVGALWQVEQKPYLPAVFSFSTSHLIAASLDLPLREFKGCVPGDDWDAAGAWRFCGDPSPAPCHVLWSTATITADGGVAPCNGTFYPDDDMGRIDPAAPAESLLAVWNGPRYRAARRFFQARTGTPAERTQVCFDCPNTRGWEDWQRHRTAGGTAGSYRSPFSTNDVWSYFWQRTPGARRAHGDRTARAAVRAS